MKTNQMKKFLQLIFVLGVLLMPIHLQAQDDEDPGTGAEGGGSVEEPAAPINEGILFLAASGIGFAMYCLNKNTSTPVQS